MATINIPWIRSKSIYTCISIAYSRSKAKNLNIPFRTLEEYKDYLSYIIYILISD
jgi:hypothetical protein